MDKQSLIEILDKMCKDIREKTGITVDMVSIKKTNPTIIAQMSRRGGEWCLTPHHSQNACAW